jgi:hypothetical protein
VSINSVYKALYLEEGSKRPLGAHSYLHSDFDENFIVYQDSYGFNNTFASIFKCFVKDVSLTMRNKKSYLEGCTIGMSETPILFSSKDEKISNFTTIISTLTSYNPDSVIVDSNENGY